MTGTKPIRNMTPDAHFQADFRWPGLRSIKGGNISPNDLQRIYKARGAHPAASHYSSFARDGRGRYNG